MIRHLYRMHPTRGAICRVCDQGRAEDVHNLLTWRKASGTGFYYGGPDNGVYYRIRTRLGKAIWWPEFSLVHEEDWTRIGNGVGVKLAQAKLMCEEHREENA